MIRVNISNARSNGSFFNSKKLRTDKRLGLKEIKFVCIIMVLGGIIFGNKPINEEKPQSNIEQEPKL